MPTAADREEFKGLLARLTPDERALLDRELIVRSNSPTQEVITGFLQKLARLDIEKARAAGPTEDKIKAMLDVAMKKAGIDHTTVPDGPAENTVRVRCPEYVREALARLPADMANDYRRQLAKAGFGSSLEGKLYQAITHDAERYSEAKAELEEAKLLAARQAEEWRRQMTERDVVEAVTAEAASPPPEAPDPLTLAYRSAVDTCVRLKRLLDDRAALRD